MPKTLAGTTLVKKDIEAACGKVSAAEFMAFWKSCSAEDKADFKTTAAENLGATPTDDGKFILD